MMIVQEDIKSQACTHLQTHKRQQLQAHTHTHIIVNDLCDLQSSLNVQLRGLTESTQGHLRLLKRSWDPVLPLLPFSLSLSAVYLCKRTMQNKARLELADYEAVSEEGLLVSALLSICALPVLALLSYLLVHTDSNNICFSVCRCIICSSLSTKLLNESLV